MIFIVMGRKTMWILSPKQAKSMILTNTEIDKLMKRIRPKEKKVELKITKSKKENKYEIKI